MVYFVWSEQRAGPLMNEVRVDTSYVFFRKSNNCGLTLDSAIFLGKGHWVSMDAQGESVFVAPVVWNSPPPEDGAYFIYSADSGYGWTEYLPIVDSASQSNIVYRNGVLHFAGSRKYKIIYTRSTDLGNSWSTPTVVTAPNTVLPKKPVLALGPNQDVYIAWTDNKYSGMMQFDDVLFRKSTDDGLTWGPEQRLTTDSHCDAGGALDIVTQDSMIFIVWCYNGIGYPAPCSLFFLASTDCGDTWRPREGVAGGSGYALNDANVAVFQNSVYVVWTDSRPLRAPPELYLRRGSLTTGITEKNQNTIIVVNCFPNPFTTDIRLQIADERYKQVDSRQKSVVSIRMFDVSGKEVFYESMKDESGCIKIDVKDLPSGIYFVQVCSGESRVIKKVIKIK